MQLDRSYGQVRFQKFSWGPNDKGEFETKRSNIQTHKCTEEEIGIPANNAKAKFWPIAQSQEIIHGAAKHLFVCVDPEEMVVQGGYDKQVAQIIYIDVVKCTGKDYCRPQDEIEKFFTQSLFQVL